MSFIKSTLVISAIACFTLAIPQAQADERRTVYTGLDCVPHNPQLNADGTGDQYSYFGSEIINQMPDGTDPNNPSTVYYNDLGMNCAIERSVFGRSSKLKSVSVLLNTTDPTTYIDPDTNVEHGSTNCHTHVEYATAGSINVIYGTDVYNPPASAGIYQTLNLPATDVAPTNDANYNIHCHISGQGSVINGYTVIEKD